MITAIRGLDERTAAGILARAALEMDDQPAALVVERELELRRRVLAEVRGELGIAPDDNSEEAKERVGESIELTIEVLLHVDVDNLARVREDLANRGDLPSDLYRIHIIQGIAKFHGVKFDQEKALIEETIRIPDKEQHYGPLGDDGPALVSLFAKSIVDEKFPGRSFVMLVAGQRSGMQLNIHQAWRLYPDSFDPVGVNDLMDLLRRFIQVFGMEVKARGVSGKIFEVPDFRPGDEVESTLNPGKPGERRLFSTTWFVHPRVRPEDEQRALIMGVDLTLYRDYLIRHGYTPPTTIGRSKPTP